jgi:hypothetical protein
MSRHRLEEHRYCRYLTRSRFDALVLFLLSFAALAVGCAHPAKPSSAQFFLARDTPVDSIRVATTEVAASRIVPAGEVEGIVVDGNWGAPLASAQVQFRDIAQPAHSIGVLTDAAGHFHLTGLPRQPITLRAALIGYIADTAHLDRKSGHFVRFGLRRQRLRVCGLRLVADPPPPMPFAISVYARDSRTSAAPRAPITIHLRDGAFAESATVLLRDTSADSLLVGAARGRDGVYDVEVTAPGYMPWYLKRVRPVVSDCDEVLGRQFTAWLIPIS